LNQSPSIIVVMLCHCLAPDMPPAAGATSELALSCRERHVSILREHPHEMRIQCEHAPHRSASNTFGPHLFLVMFMFVLFAAIVAIKISSVSVIDSAAALPQKTRAAILSDANNIAG
jgi:hypothetical protein